MATFVAFFKENLESMSFRLVHEVEDEHVDSFEVRGLQRSCGCQPSKHRKPSCHPPATAKVHQVFVCSSHRANAVFPQMHDAVARLHSALHTSSISFGWTVLAVYPIGRGTPRQSKAPISTIPHAASQCHEKRRLGSALSFFHVTCLSVASDASR